MIDYDILMEDCVETAANPTSKEHEILEVRLPTPGQSMEFLPIDLEFTKRELNGKDVSALVAKAQTLVIETDQEAQQGLSLAMQSRKLCNSIEKTRKSIVRPHIDFQKACAEISNSFTLKLKEMESGVIKKLELYQEKRKESMKAFGILDESFDSLAVDDGACKTVSEWGYEIQDIEKVSIEYLQINEKAVKDALKNGRREIAGLSITETKKRRYRARTCKPTS